MVEINRPSVTDKNLDRLADFLVSELEQPKSGQSDTTWRAYLSRCS